MRRRGIANSQTGGGAVTGAPGRIMLGMMLVVALVALLAVTTSVAREKKPEVWKPKVVRPNNLPPMRFLSGTLNRDGLGNWRIGETQIWFTRDSRLVDIDRPGEGRPPRRGQEVLLMGQRLGTSFIVRRGVVLDPGSAFETYAADPGLEWSEEDADVGWGESPQ